MFHKFAFSTTTTTTTTIDSSVVFYKSAFSTTTTTTIALLCLISLTCLATTTTTQIFKDTFKVLFLLIRILTPTLKRRLQLNVTKRGRKNKIRKNNFKDKNNWKKLGKDNRLCDSLPIQSKEKKWVSLNKIKLWNLVFFNYCWQQLLQFKSRLPHAI